MFGSSVWWGGRREAQTRRRRGASLVWGGEFEGLEGRCLLSGIATVAEVGAAEAGGAVSAAESAVETAKTDVAPSAVADGKWTFDTDVIDGKIAITQTGVKAKTTLEYGLFKLVGKGVIRNENLILKFKAFIGPFNAKLNVKANLVDGDHFTGTLKGKLPVVGKFETPINGTRV